MSDYNLGNLSSDDLELLSLALNKEVALRNAIDRFRSSIFEIAKYRTNDRNPYSEWVFPVKPEDSYMSSEIVSFNDQHWESTHDFNSGTPGISGWRLKTNSDEAPAPYLQPSGSHDSYRLGEKITWTDGLVYTSTEDGVMQNPDEKPTAWSKENPLDPPQESN